MPLPTVLQSPTATRSARPRERMKEFPLQFSCPVPCWLRLSKPNASARLKRRLHAPTAAVTAVAIAPEQLLRPELPSDIGVLAIYYPAM